MVGAIILTAVLTALYLLMSLEVEEDRTRFNIKKVGLHLLIMAMSLTLAVMKK